MQCQVLGHLVFECLDMFAHARASGRMAGIAVVTRQQTCRQHTQLKQAHAIQSKASLEFGARALRVSYILGCWAAGFDLLNLP